MKTYPVRRPDQQGHIDGMCGVYAVLNACVYLLDLKEEIDGKLFEALCSGTPQLFPRIVYGGAGFDGVLDLLGCAQKWIERHHPSRRLAWSREMPKHRTFASATAVFRAMDTGLREVRDNGGRAIWIVGLGPPWGHWTAISSIGERRVHFRDSYGIKHRDISRFTIDGSKAGVGKKIMLDYHQNLLLTLDRAAAR